MENNSCLVINERGVIVSEGFRAKKYFGKICSKVLAIVITWQQRALLQALQFLQLVSREEPPFHQEIAAAWQ